MTPKPTSVAKQAAPQTPIRVALLTMDNHLASAAERAALALRQRIPGLSFALHSASNWRDDETALAASLASINEADLIIVAMLFMEDHYLPVLDALKARREHCDAMVCIMSAPAVMQLTRMGKFNPGADSGGLMSLLKKLRPAARQNHDKEESSSSAGAKQMAMLRRLPKLLRFIPGTAQDLRIFFLTMRYWLAGSEPNISSMVQLLIKRYASAERQVLRELAQPQDPVEYPDVGLYHPRIKGRISDQLSDLPASSKTQPTVGLLLLRSYLLANNTKHYDAVIEALEAKGLRVIAAYASGLDSRPAVERYFKSNNKTAIDILVSLTGFSLIGGPAYNDAKAAEAILSQLDVPYLAAHALEFQSLDQWSQSNRGLMPVENTIMVAIPELDGSTVPMVYGGRAGANGTLCSCCDQPIEACQGQKNENMYACPERVEMLACRIAKLVALRRSKPDQRKVAIVLFNFPPNAGAVGTAAFLSVFESLFNILRALAKQGYRVTLPDNADALRQAVMGGNASRYGTEANVHTLIPTTQHLQQESWLDEIEAQWGPAPGKHLSNSQGIFILGAQFGEVLVTLQPGFGYEGDPMRLLFGSGLAPTHAFSAFYRYLRDDFKADCVLHFGTHGALEFMPGKQAGMSARCWPDRLIGALPNVYLYAANNPSEGVLAKRRAAATLVSYLTPALVHAGLYKGLVELKQSLQRWRELEPEQNKDRCELAQMLFEQAKALDLALPVSQPELSQTQANGAPVPWIDALQAQILELEYTLIPQGLHIVGQQPTREQRLSTLGILAPAMGIDRPDLIERLVDGASVTELTTWAKDLSEKQLQTLEQLVTANQQLGWDSEIEGLLKAFDGRYIAPAPGGDLLHNLKVLPTGRNMHGIDPFRIPSAFAVKDAQRQSNKLIARYLEDGGAMPETVAMVLWGTDNLKTEGGPLAQALALMGALPRFDSYGRLAGACLIPLAELARPRIDVVITLSGIFRDLLPMQIRLLAEAAFLAACADEPEEQNYVRKHALAFMAEHQTDIETASLRVFGNAEGAYGANVNQLIDSSVWQNEDELGDCFVQRKGFAYGRAGRPVRNNALLQSALSSVCLAYQNLDSVELGVTSIDTYFDTLGGISRAVLQAKHKTFGSSADTPPVPVYISDQTQKEGVVRSLTEQVSLETRTRMLNPKWHESMLQHGYEGVRQIEAHLTNTMGWSATTGQVQPWVYQQLAQTFILDPQMRERLAQLNPVASTKFVNRLLEASRRQYWQPNAETMDSLRLAGEELEDRLEGVYEGSPA